MKFKIHSWSDWATGEMKIVVIQEHAEDSRPGFWTVCNLYTSEVQVLETGKLVPDSFIIRLPWTIGLLIKKAFADWLHNEGVRPEEVIKREAGIEGKLQATKYHLEDLRQLLKLNTEKDRIPK